MHELIYYVCMYVCMYACICKKKIIVVLPIFWYKIRYRYVQKTDYTNTHSYTVA